MSIAVSLENNRHSTLTLNVKSDVRLQFFFVYLQLDKKYFYHQNLWPHVQSTSNGRVV